MSANDVPYADMQTRYMRALKEMIYSRGPFGLEKVQMKHGVSSLGKILRELEWVKVEAPNEGTLWIGPIPEDEAHLSSMATILRKEVKKAGRAYRASREQKPVITDENHAMRQLIERLANGTQGFSTDVMVERFDLPIHLAQALRDIHWVKARQGSDLEVWIGPPIKTADQLTKAVEFLDQYRVMPDREVEDIADGNTWAVGSPAHDAPCEQVAQANVPDPPPPSPQPPPVIERPRIKVRILWGLYEIEKIG